jgi:hypothetical protein
MVQDESTARARHPQKEQIKGAIDFSIVFLEESFLLK